MLVGSTIYISLQTPEISLILKFVHERISFTNRSNKGIFFSKHGVYIHGVAFCKEGLSVDESVAVENDN